MGKSKRYYRRKYKKVSWCSNITNIRTVGLVANRNNFSSTATLISNPVQNILSTSQIFTVKNVEVSFNLQSQYVQYINQITIYIMFVPQGMNVGDNYHIQHPEFIMAMRYLGQPDYGTDANRNAVKVKTRLARRLNTGDSVVLYINGWNSDDEQLNYSIYGVVRWWTKAN